MPTQSLNCVFCLEEEDDLKTMVKFYGTTHAVHLICWSDYIDSETLLKNEKLNLSCPLCRTKELSPFFRLRVLQYNQLAIAVELENLELSIQTITALMQSDKMIILDRIIHILREKAINNIVFMKRILMFTIPFGTIIKVESLYEALLCTAVIDSLDLFDRLLYNYNGKLEAKKIVNAALPSIDCINAAFRFTGNLACFFTELNYFSPGKITEINVLNELVKKLEATEEKINELCLEAALNGTPLIYDFSSNTLRYDN